MNLNRPNRYPRQRSRDPLDKRVDQWIETGRQFVDGVAGNRPGLRKHFRSNRRSRSSLETVGRWVGDKIDWLMEDDENWLEPWQEESSYVMAHQNKRPLDAISLRVPADSIEESRKAKAIDFKDDDWPEEKDFKIGKWKRNNSPVDTADSRKQSQRGQLSRNSSRPLPRSSRRKD